MSNYNEENLRRYFPHLYANNSTVNGEEINLTYIIENKPSIKKVRDFFREKSRIINEKNDEKDEEALSDLM